MKVSQIGLIGLIGLTVALLGIATAALALPTFVPVFSSTYKVAKGSNLDKAKCAVCHMGMSKTLNPYGQDLKKALSAPKKITPEALKKIEGLDSDKDGKKNLDEIKADSLPGDPAK